MTVFIYVCIVVIAIVIIAMILAFIWLLAKGLRMTDGVRFPIRRADTDPR